MKSTLPQTPEKSRLQWFSKKVFAISGAALLVAGPASAATIGLHFMTGANVGGTNGAALAPGSSAGAPSYAQVNWNNLAGGTGTNVAVADSSGTASGVAVSWASPNTWSQSGNTTADQGSPDANLMNPYLDNNGNANVTLLPNMFDTSANNNRNYPLVYLTGLQAWLTSQGAAAYDVVIYSDGDNAGGRVGEFWPITASGAPTALTYGADLRTHAFICDRNNFIVTPVYTEVPAFVQGGEVAEYGNFFGNLTVLTSLTNDTVLLRSQRFNSRAPINAVQILPRATALGPSIAPIAPANVFAGATAKFAATVAGGVPMTFQWQKNGVNLTDAGNISGSTTKTLTVASVTGGDVASYTLIASNSAGLTTSIGAPLAIVTPVANSFVEKIVTNVPYAYWRLNDIVDTTTNFAPALDYAGKFTGNYGNSAQSAYNGVVGPQPTDFPGFENNNSAYQSANNVGRTYITAPPLNLNTNTATICAWIYPTAAQGGFTTLVTSRNGNDVAAFGFGNNNNLGYTWNSNSAATYNFVSGLIPPTNQWSFVALTISPTNGIISLFSTNGQLSITNSIAHTVEACTGNTYLGDDPLGAGVGTPQGRSFVGVIDEIAIFNRTLPQSEVYNLYKKGLGLNAIGPVIPTQPQSLALYEGRNAQFNITASGDTPLSYQWRKNGNNITGATTPTLNLNNVSIATDAASYDIVVGNIVGSVTSSIATLTVVASNSTPSAYEAKLRQLNPISYWRLNESTGSPYSYDYWGGQIATNENVFLGVAGPVPPDFIGMDAGNTAGQYDGFTADTASSVSLINNRAAFSIVGWFNSAGTQPARTGLFGQNDVAEFGFHAADASGEAMLGMWTPNAAAYLGQTNVTPGVWYLIAGVASGTNVNLFLLSTNGGGGFQVLQSTTAGTTTNYGSSAFSFKIGGGGILDATGNYFTGDIDEVAVFNRALSVSEMSDLFGAAFTGGALPPGISGQPGSLTLYAGRTATFNVSAVGSSLSYQWRSNGVAIHDVGTVSGSTTPTLTIASVAASNAANYDVVVTNIVGSVTSSVASLTVITPVANSYESAAIALNPFAYYRLNETNDPSSGTVLAADYWGGHSGVYGSGAMNAFNSVLGPVPPGFPGFQSDNGALQTTINVASSYATAPVGSLSTNTVTFTAWLYPNGAQPAWAGLLVNRNAGVAGGFNYNDQQMLGYTWNNNSGATWGFVSGLVIPSNQWSFVAVAISPANAVLYLYDSAGVFAATNVLAHTSDVFGNNWQIGSDNSDNLNDGTRTFNGIIDEVALYTQTLSESQITQLYNAGGRAIVSLNIQASGPNVIVSWPQGTLLESSSVLGPWTTNTATSPYTTPATADKKFYKVIVR